MKTVLHGIIDSHQKNRISGKYENNRRNENNIYTSIHFYDRKTGQPKLDMYFVLVCRKTVAAGKCDKLI